MKASGGVALAIVLALAGCAGSDRAPAAVSSVAVNEERVTIPADPFPSTYRPAPSDVTVIRGATMFDGEGGRIDGGAIRLANGRIEAIGGRDLAVPEGATVIDTAGKWVAPGIMPIQSAIDNYTHLAVSEYSGGNERRGIPHAGDT